MVLRELRERILQRGNSYDERLRLTFAHVLDQASDRLGSRFSWHQDTEENHRGRSIQWSMVVVLRMDAHGKAAPMQIAGAEQVSTYTAVGEYHVFPSALYHSTVASEHGGLKLGMFFAVPW